MGNTELSSHRVLLAQLAIVLGVLGFAGTAEAQVVGASIWGTVRDSSGDGIPAVSVTIKNLETGAARKLVSDESGRYVAPSIAVGRYEVIADKEGFSSQVKTGIDLVVGQTSTVDLVLPVGEVRQVVTVEDKAPVVSDSHPADIRPCDERQVKELPLNGRSYDNLMSLNPGVVNYSVRTLRRRGNVQFRCRQHVRCFRTQKPGESVSAERS